MKKDNEDSSPTGFTFTIIEGPNQGQKLVFEGHDTFLVGRSKHAHFRLPDQDPYFSRIHFLVEVNPPRCRVQDMGSHNGTFVNGQRVKAADLHDGDEIKAGHTTIRVTFPLPLSPSTVSLPGSPVKDLPEEPGRAGETAPPSLPIVQGYRLKRELGRGATGVIYLAIRESDGKKMALKTIVPGVGVSAKQVKRFLREARILCQLEHPHIVPFKDMGECGGLLYFAMEYVKGTSAAQYLKEHGPLSVRQATRVLIQVMGALEYAHAKGFVHRDIKPSNILMARSKNRWTMMLADFGLARAYQESELSGLTLEGDGGGTIPFMPPEQISNFRQAKPASDQYSAAATLYNLLTGKFLFDFDRAQAPPLALVLEGQPVPIRQRRPTLPEGLVQVINRALAHDPGARYQDIQAFKQALVPFAR